MDSITKEKKKDVFKLKQKTFPNLVDGKINTEKFLEGSKGVVDIIVKFGSGFSPMSYDLSGNIEKLQKCYEKNPSKYMYVDDLAVCEPTVASDALLWLHRALNFFLIFFQRIVEDNDKTESLQDHLVRAYAQTLEPHHGWVTRQIIVLFKRLIPNRSILLATIAEDEEVGEDAVVQALKIYLENLRMNISHIISFSEEHSLKCGQTTP